MATRKGAGLSGLPSFNGLRTAIENFRSDRERGKELTEQAKKQQPVLIDEMKEVGVTGDVGIVWNEDDPEKGVAFIQQNSGSVVWDHEKIIEWLRKPVKGRGRLWTASSSRVWDSQKWEALVASGDIPPKVAKRFKTTTPEPAPFIRFGKAKKGEEVL